MKPVWEGAQGGGWEALKARCHSSEQVEVLLTAHS